MIIKQKKGHGGEPTGPFFIVPYINVQFGPGTQTDICLLINFNVDMR